MIARRIYKGLFGLKRHERLLRVPRQYANTLEHLHDDPDAALIMGTSSARSPENVRALMKALEVERVEQLLPFLPDQRHRRHPLRRIRTYLRHLFGGSPYDPDLSRERRLRARGYFSHPDIHRRLALVKDYLREGGESDAEEEDA